MTGYFLKNSNGEYLKTLNTAESKIDFTKNPNEAINYNGLPGGGQWSAENEKQFLDFHFGDEYGERVKSLRCVCEEW